MKSVIEIWDKGKLISHEEKNDDRPTIEDLEKRLKIIEVKIAALPKIPVG